jgi:hypothetical protein
MDLVKSCGFDVHAVHRIGYVEHSGMELSQEEQSGNLLLVAEKPLN